jgi:hypothetical protein
MLKVLWNYKQFTSEQDAKEYCLSKECDDAILNLNGLTYSLSEQSKLEIPVPQGHGYPLDTPSGMESSYTSNEASRLTTLRDYFRGVNPNPGYLWKYSTHGLHSVNQVIDTSNLNSVHPVFLDYVKDNNIEDNDIKDAYIIWENYIKNPTMNNLFKVTYWYKIKDLIPFVKKD